VEKCKYLFHDESGDLGDDCFLIGLLKAHAREPLDAAIKRARDAWHFQNELHFSKISNLRARVYKEVIGEIAREARHFHFSSICIKKEHLDLGYFDNKKHLAYNYFTKLLLKHRCHNVAGAVLITDEKTRKIEDNFAEYIEWEVNRVLCLHPNPIERVQIISSKKDDLLQLVDLLLGCAGCLQRRTSSLRKMDVAECAKRSGLLKDIWLWSPKKKNGTPTKS
jgi:Protein of unknown function (DUF3800)